MLRGMSGSVATTRVYGRDGRLLTSLGAENMSSRFGERNRVLMRSSNRKNRGSNLEEPLADADTSACHMHYWTVNSLLVPSYVVSSPVPLFHVPAKRIRYLPGAASDGTFQTIRVVDQ